MTFKSNFLFLNSPNSRPMQTTAYSDSSALSRHPKLCIGSTPFSFLAILEMAHLSSQTTDGVLDLFPSLISLIKSINKFFYLDFQSIAPV